MKKNQGVSLISGMMILLLASSQCFAYGPRVMENPSMEQAEQQKAVHLESGDESMPATGRGNQIDSKSQGQGQDSWGANAGKESGALSTPPGDNSKNNTSNQGGVGNGNFLSPGTNAGGNTNTGQPDYSSYMNEYMARMQEVAKLMIKLGKWMDYLNKVNAALGMMKGLKEQLKGLHERFSELDAALGSLLTAIGNAPSNPGMPYISIPTYNRYLKDRLEIGDEFDEAHAKSSNAVGAAIGELEGEKSTAEATIDQIKEEMARIMSSGGTASGIADPPEDLSSSIKSNMTKANGNFSLAQRKYFSLKNLARNILEHVWRIVEAYRRQGIVLTAQQQAVVNAAGELARLV